MNQELTLIETIRIITKWKKHLSIAVATSGVVAALFSLFVMDEYYFSWSVLYPINQMQSDRAVIFNTESAVGQVEYFGTKSDVNRLVSVANSASIREYIIDSFKLIQHYKINPQDKYAREKARKKFNRNYKAVRNEREAIEISIYDTNPKMAENILTAIIQKMDEINKHSIYETKQQLYHLIREQIAEQQIKIQKINDSLAELSARYNIKTSVGADGTLVVSGSDHKAAQGIL
jgi:Chain length determinant protein.